jgi:hypothetical protein
MIQVKEQFLRSDKMEINEDLLYIKRFSKITIKKVCKRLGIDESNLWSGKTSKNNMKRVRRLLEDEIAHLYLVNENERNSTL